MTFQEVLAQVAEWLQRDKRVSYRALKRQFAIDDDYLDDLRYELVEVRQVADEQDGDMLVWTGESGARAASTPALSQTMPQPVARGSQAPRKASPSHKPPLPDAERRQLTVMFCDLADSTRLSGQLDPEDLRDVIRAYQDAGSEVIERYGGYIAQHLGDGLMVYFGWPQAHEDDAQRAVHAGLGILETMQGLNARLEPTKGVRLAVRIGIHTGLVVVGEIGKGDSQEHLALGETPNIASRIEGLAELDSMAISDVTYRLIQGYFVCADLGCHTLKGVAEPTRAYRVVGASGAWNRLEAATTRELTPLIGRESEVTLLVERWQQVKKNQGQVVLLSGEAGIGKSRLIQALKGHLADEAYTRLECRSSPYYQNTALYPIIDFLQRALRWHQNDTPETKFEKLEDNLGQYRLQLEEAVPLLATLLSLAIPEGRYPSLALTPQRQRQKTLDIMLSILMQLAERQPVLFILEDLHWTDPSTFAFLDLMMEQVPGARILTLLTCRPAFQRPWRRRSYLMQIPLDRLSRHQVENMVEQITGGRTLPEAVLRQIVSKTDGVPLYVEEMTKAVLESDLLQDAERHRGHAGLSAALAIPATLQDSLMARLDRLMSAKGIAQLGAVMGRQFSYALIRAVARFDDVVLERELGRLVQAELLYQRGLPPEATYVFKHALIQDTAYESLLKSKRQQYHQRIAQVLEGQFSDTVDAQPELLAHHYTEAGLNVQAIPYWQRAGQRAVERSANLEAIEHLRNGLALLDVCPDTSERARQELGLQTALGAALMAAKSYAAPEVEHAYVRARELCRQLGEHHQLYTVMRGLWGFYVVRDELRMAHDLGKECLALAQRARNPVFVLWAHYALGMTLFHLGETTLAREHFEQGIVLYDPRKRRSHRALQDPGVACLSYRALALWLLGYPDQAMQTSREAVALAYKLSHPFSLNYALNLATAVCQLSRQATEGVQRAEAASALASEHGIPYWMAWGRILLGWAQIEQGDREAGILLTRQGLADYGAAGGEVARPFFLALLADAYGKVGQAEAGLGALAEALAVAHQTGECWLEAELYRLKGEFSLVMFSCNDTEAEACFLQALDIARRQSAKSLELRAAISLCRLWQGQSKRQEARRVLAEVYGWFTEGFDTLDLKEARALLETLA